MHRAGRAFATLIIALAAAALGAAGCTSPQAGQPNTGQPGTGQPGTGQSGTGAPPSATAPATPPVSCGSGWRTTALSVSRQIQVPPVPVATAVRTGSHPDCKFDRLVIDISGPVPGYAASFVAQVTRDASGRTVTLPGTTYLLIRLTPAQGHTASGRPTLPAGVRTVAGPMLQGWTVTGDFEGVLSVALGLAGGTRYRIGELSGRVYVDVAWRNA